MSAAGASCSFLFKSELPFTDLEAAHSKGDDTAHGVIAGLHVRCKSNTEMATVAELGMCFAAHETQAGASAAASRTSEESLAV